MSQASRRVLLVVAALAVSWSAQSTMNAQEDHPEHLLFPLGDFTFESGETLPDAHTLYVTHGELNEDRSNAILLVSSYGGTHHGYDYLIGSGLALDPEEYFVIATEMFGSGGSSSPSNTPPPFDHARFPAVTIRDNVRATYRLVTEQFGITHLKAVIGFSMGAQQAFQWAVSHPDFMDVVVPLAGMAKTYPHGFARLESALVLITGDPNFQAGQQTLTDGGRTAWAHHWAAWVRSPMWWRQELFKSEQTPTLGAYLRASAEQRSSDERPHDRITQGRAWQEHDVGDTPGFDGDLERALASIRAKVIYMPGETDMYFPLADAEYERPFIPDVEFVPIPSIWGHSAGAGPNPSDRAFIDAVIRRGLRGTGS